jgi:hypothetical protein
MPAAEHVTSFWIIVQVHIFNSATGQWSPGTSQSLVRCAQAIQFHLTPVFSFVLNSLYASAYCAEILQSRWSTRCLGIKEAWPCAQHGLGKMPATE